MDSLSQDLSNTALRAVSQGVMISDAKRNIIFINPAFTSITGYAAEQVLGQPATLLQGPQSDEAKLAEIQQAVQSGLGFGGVIYYYRKDGSGFWNELSITPVKDDRGAISYFVDVIRNIEDHKDIQLMLLESLQRYQDLMDNVHVGVLVQGAQGEVLFGNRYALELLDYAESEIKGKTSFDPAWDIVHDDGTAFVLTELPVPQAIESKRFVKDVVMGIWRPRRNDRIWLKVSANPVLDVQGAVSRVIVTLVDHTTMKASESKLIESRVAMQSLALHSQAVVDNMLDAVITINVKGVVESFSKSAARMFGYTPDELIGKNVSLLMPMPHRATHNIYLGHYEKTGEARMIGFPRELHGQRKDGSLIPISLSVNKIERDGAPFFVGILRDISQRRHDEEEIRRLAFYDSLTNLPNRRLLVDRLHIALANAARVGKQGAVLMLDLDHFKAINESLGHKTGDMLLQQVANRLTGCLREGDSVARLGGDEFVVLLEGMSGNSKDAATLTATVASVLHDAISQSYDLDGQTLNITPSIGMVLFNEQSNSTDELLKMADIALYQAKSAGRNTVRFYDPEMQAQAAQRAEMLRAMRSGLEQGEFILHYQLQFSRDAKVIGAESLVRWKHPVQGMVSPAAFIPLAEESGLILPLGIHVLESACKQLRTWSQDPATADWKLAVNVSAKQLAQDSFVEDVSGVLQRTGANPQRLKLELTESMLAENVEDLIVKMHAIRTLGVGFSLDDFGTGYSSLSFLKRLPLAQLKIDQSFVRDLETDPNDAVIASTVVALGHSLGLNVIAEGVETTAQRDFLLSCGCDAFQGYLFARPRPAEELQALLK